MIEERLFNIIERYWNYATFSDGFFLFVPWSRIASINSFAS